MLTFQRRQIGCLSIFFLIVCLLPTAFSVVENCSFKIKSRTYECKDRNTPKTYHIFPQGSDFDDQYVKCCGLNAQPLWVETSEEENYIGKLMQGLGFEGVWMGGQKSPVRAMWKSCGNMYKNIDYDSYRYQNLLRRNYMVLKLFSGQAIPMSECKPNFHYPIICEKCPEGTYGYQCENDCSHCIENSCHYEFGTCYIRCKPGVYGEGCLAPRVTPKPYTVDRKPLRPECTKLDIVFLLDGFTNIGEENFMKLKNSLKYLVGFFPIGQDAVRVGLVTSSNDTIFNLNSHNNIINLLIAINDITYPMRPASTKDGLNYLKTRLFTSENGDREDVQNYAVVITDGVSTDLQAIEKAATALKEDNVGIYCLGIGSEGMDTLQYIASDPTNHFIETIENVNEFPYIKQKLQNMCEQCPEGTYGYQCENDCSHCIENSCHYEFGTCYIGCKPGVYGEGCPAPLNQHPPQTGNDQSPQTTCEKLDIVFLLDGFTNIGEENFMKLKKLVKYLVGFFPIGQDAVRVGLVTSSNVTSFNLNSHPASESLLRAIDQITYPMGPASTKDGLSYLKNQMFTSKNGDREDVFDIAIVITDGVWTDLEATKGAATALKEDNVEIHCVAIGSEGMDALQFIASDPKYHTITTMEKINEFGPVQERLERLCGLDEQPLEPTCEKLDIVFLLDGFTNIGEEKFMKLKKLVKYLAGVFPIGQNAVRVGLVTSSNDTSFNLNSHPASESLLRAIDQITYPMGPASTKDGLSYLKNQMFTSKNGDREDVFNIAVVITDGVWTDLEATKEAATALKEDNVEIHCVAIGSEGMDALQFIASDPKYHTITTMEKINEFDPIQERLERLCGRVTPKPYTDVGGPSLPAKCPSGYGEDMVVVRNNTCYYVFDTRSSFASANEKCCQIEGHLLWFQSSDDDFKFAVERFSNYTPTWIGAVRDGDHSYELSSCIPKQHIHAKHMNWADGHPLESNTHAMLNGGKSYSISETSQHWKLSIICQVCAPGTFGKECELLEPPVETDM